ncbi:MAG: GGDEF domain-containing protein [Clostridium sp.]
MWIVLQINICMCFLMLLITIHGYFKLGTTKSIYRIFLLATALIILIMVLECITVVVNGHATSLYTVYLSRVVNILGFALTPVIPYLYWCFLCNWLNGKDIFYKVNKTFWVLLGINGIMSILSFSNKIIFYVDDKGVYQRGELFITNLIICLVILLGCAYLILKNYSRLSIDEKGVFTLNLIIPVVLSAFQIIKINILTIWSSCGIICILTYVFLLNEKSKTDTLTGLYNKEAYYDEIRRISKGKYKKLTIINMDLDKFKSINDRFGHIEGDIALKALSNILNTTFNGIGKIIRYGGDEFWVFFYEDEPLKINTIMDLLLSRIKEYNTQANKSYDINISYGVKICSDNIKDIDDVLIECDKLMYANKKKKSISHNNF